MSKDARFIIDRSGKLSSTDGKLRKWLANRAGAWKPMPSPKELIVLERYEGEREGEAVDERIRICGTISAHGELTDIINMIYPSRWEGSLHVISREGRKTLLIKAGDIVGAASTAESDRLGELLCAYGVITRKQLADALAEAGGPQRLGAALVARKIITPHQLYSYLKKQVEEIFYGLLLLNEGTYYFYHRDLADPAYRQLRIPLDGLLLAGVQRLDEMRYFKEKIPSAEIVFEAGELRASVSLNEGDFAFLRLVNGRRDLAEIARMAQVSEYDATKAAYRLLQFGVIRPRSEEFLGRPGQLAKNAGMNEVIELTNSVLALLFSEASRVDRDLELRQAPRAFYAAATLYSPLLRGVEVSGNGNVDSTLLARNLEVVDPGDQADFLYQGLNEFLSFAIFMVVEGLEPDAERRIRGVVEKVLCGTGLAPIPTPRAEP